MGFKEESLSTNESEKVTKEWREANCQPNFRKVQKILVVGY